MGNAFLEITEIEARRDCGVFVYRLQIAGTSGPRQCQGDERDGKMCDMKDMPFDVKRMTYGGFNVLVDV